MDAHPEKERDAASGFKGIPRRASPSIGMTKRHKAPPLSEGGGFNCFNCARQKKLKLDREKESFIFDLGVGEGVVSFGAAGAAVGAGDEARGHEVVDAGGAIAKADVDKIMEEVFMDGGHPDLLVMNPRVANQLRALLDNSSFCAGEPGREQNWACGQSTR